MIRWPLHLLLIQSADFCSRYKPDVIKGDMDSIRKEVLEFYASMVSELVWTPIFCVILDIFSYHYCFHIWKTWGRWCCPLELFGRWFTILYENNVIGTDFFNAFYYVVAVLLLLDLYTCGALVFAQIVCVCYLNAGNQDNWWIWWSGYHWST